MGNPHTTIGITTFHFWVRHGVRWCYCILAARIILSIHYFSFSRFCFCFCFSQCICLFCLYPIVFSCSFFDASRLSLNLTQAVYLLLFFLFAFLAFRFSSCVCLFTRPAKTLQRCIVKPLGQLVWVSSTAHTAYTPHLSTSSSSTTLTNFKSGRTHLGASFVLRCFQHLSLPHLATGQCHWHDNPNTSGAFTPVLSY